IGQKGGHALADQWMDYAFQGCHSVGVADDALGKQPPINFSSWADTGNKRLHRLGRLALVEVVNRVVGRKGRDAHRGHHVEHCRLAGCGRARGPEPEHQSVASIVARKSGVTSGLTPTRASKPGTAWCNSMPRPST